MPHRAMPFGNDNIRTSHLKCDQCKTRTSLQGIERSRGFETRLFGCAHCGAVKTIQIGAPDPIAVSS
ncbi:hypothetical protein SAMN03159423_5706 [Bradyrhizobium sp. NFR13]|uniref:hypothetical protein n=1 Tax=Bradyrhizobium sp. NFR13 TaxID=1566285 RepID=UPI0008E22652|nr:hypothetical protein [Bradyrhizobium sp. NFR13]SFM15243.1 hypothetical protein SAMN03159423_5706 [Bradyrhizobium sp. NFR13]